LDGKRTFRENPPMRVHRLHRFILTVVLAGSGAVAVAEEPAASAAADEQLLKAAGVGTDAMALQAFFRQRTLGESDRTQIEAWVRQLGSEQFREREEASKQLARRGPPARPFLVAARRSSDPEVSRRAARCLEEIDSGPGPAVSAAAARLLVQRDPSGAAACLLAYLPFSEDDGTSQEVMDALMLRAPGGAADPVLREALHDPHPIRRGAAGYVLGRSRDPRVRDAVRPLLADKEPRVRFLAAQGLLGGRDKAAVPVLIALLNEVPKDMTWQVEDCLLRLAGGQAPAALGAAADDGDKRRSAWAKWWRDNADKVDLARFGEAPPLLGLTLVPEMHANKVWECGADGKPQWEIKDLKRPIDAQVLPGGRLLVAELDGNRVTERDRQGAILWQQKVDMPIACQRLPGGRTFIATNHRVFVVTHDGKEESSYKPENGFFIHSAQRMRDGHVVCVSIEGVLREVDAGGREVRSIKLPIRSGWSGVETVPGGRYLIANCNNGHVFEVDRDGKTVWECKVLGACYASRLRNGRTLIVSHSTGIIEVDAGGKTVWSRPMSTPLWRAHRR
jgi:HEAT repeat protein